MPQYVLCVCVCASIFVKYSKYDYQPDESWLYYAGVLHAIQISCDLFNDTLNNHFVKCRW
jgi:hypothetical protein